MALSFKVKAISRARILKNISISIIFFLSFLLILFSKSDILFVNKINKKDNKKIIDKDKFFRNLDLDIALTLNDSAIRFNQRQIHR